MNLLASNFNGLMIFLFWLVTTLCLMLVIGSALIFSALRHPGGLSSKVKLAIGATLLAVVLGYLVFLATTSLTGIGS